MALARGLFVVLLGVALPLLLFSVETEASEMGVNYGRVGNNIPDPAVVSKLLKDNGITKVRIYDAKPEVLKSLANTGIKVMVMLPNQNIADAASSPPNALQWVQTNVAPYLPDTKIQGVAVGNEVFDSNPELNSQLVPAMKNVQAALAQLGLDNDVKVSTPVAFDALQNSFPPSAGQFKDDIKPVMKPMLDFLKQTGSYLTMNIYPFFAYAAQPDTIKLDYALGNSNSGVLDENTGYTYYNLLDAQRDAAHYAMENLGDYAGVSLYVTESGWPSRGKINPGHRGRRLLDTDGGAETVANAQAYNNNLINRVVSGNTGTPHRPNADMDAYIFALFNENNKSQDPNDIENNFGLFDPETRQKIYDFSFQGTGKPPAVPTPAPESWCVANAAVGDDRLQAALDYACGHGADCSAIQPGGSCFDPNTKLAHASYAVNSYYQNKNRVPVACDFNGAASIVYQKPADTCGQKPPMSWCVANAAVGNARLQTALDYACANGADCSAIQPGGSCFQPNTIVAHASYAFDSYYQAKGRASGACDFSGAGTIVNQQPANTCGVSSATWCVANSAVGDARLQTALDYACANGADCSAIQSGGSCFDPNTKVAHASYAFNSYYQRKKRAPGTCDFSGAGSIVNQAPKFGNCVLPSNG
ncbi:hypothetical protein QOZ80_7BG0602370 [Eleusine coracana subsp. coracana]|nr:hypothetical protein QOZ80_7BG0602370 [Eleusine coracana subsp. coracana]